MNARWLVMTMLLHSAVPAMAQLSDDPDNPTIILPDPPAKVQNPIPPSQVNAGTAAVSPAIDTVSAKASGCNAHNPCVAPIPARRS